MKKKKMNEAINRYDKAIELDENYVVAWTSKANAQIKRNPIWVSLGTVAIALGMTLFVPYPYSALPTISLALLITWYYTKNERKSLRN